VYFLNAIEVSFSWVLHPGNSKGKWL